MKLKNGKKLIKNTLATLFFGVLLFAILLLAYGTIARISGKPPQVFGYSFHYVPSRSMHPDIKAGDLIVVKKATLKALYLNNKDKLEKDKDVIVFVTKDEGGNDMLVVHKIREIIKVDDNYFAYTYGTNNQFDDENSTQEIIGKVVHVSTKLGKLFNPSTMILLMLVIAITTFISYKIKSYLKSYRSD